MTAPSPPVAERCGFVDDAGSPCPQPERSNRYFEWIHRWDGPCKTPMDHPFTPLPARPSEGDSITLTENSGAEVESRPLTGKPSSKAGSAADEGGEGGRATGPLESSAYREPGQSGGPHLPAEDTPSPGSEGCEACETWKVTRSYADDQADWENQHHFRIRTLEARLREVEAERDGAEFEMKTARGYLGHIVDICDDVNQSWKSKIEYIRDVADNGSRMKARSASERGGKR